MVLALIKEYWRVFALGMLLLMLLFTAELASSEKKRADAAITERDEAKATIDDMRNRQRDVAALDAKYTGELADAKRTIEDLQRDVATGKRRLQLNATCSKGNSPTTSSMGDGTSPRLTDDARFNYFRLRTGIAKMTGQVIYLQQYIQQQCLK